MPVPQNTESTTVPEVRDREFQEHLAALGLTTAEEYLNWCAQHGFSVRVKKHWHQRCKERYFACDHEIRTRCIRKKQESRHPRRTILKIVNNELVAAEVTQPHLIAICEVFSSLEGDARDAFLRLLLHIQDCTDLLRSEPVIRHFGTQAGNTYIDALSALAKHHGVWLRSPESWRPPTHNSRRQFSSLARHLMAKYPTPVFMDSVWFKGRAPEAQKQQQWFLGIGDGKSPRELDVPVRFTKRMVHHFFHAPADCTVEAAFRWGQVLGLGGDVRLVEAILGSKLAADFAHDEFWISVIRWLIDNPMLDRLHVAPIVDYIHYQKFEPQQVATAPGEIEPRPLQPEFSMKGRTPASLLRQIQEWHGELQKEPQQTQVQWYESGIGEFDWTEGTTASENHRHWTIKEILTRKDLFGEGCAMRHCVASYENSCATGQTSIWSMGIERNGGRRKRALTVEVGIDRKILCQARGKTNRLPTEKEMDILRRWAIQEGLTVAEHVKSR